MGSGYRPVHAAVWLLILLVAATTGFALAPSTCGQDS